MFCDQMSCIQIETLYKTTDMVDTISIRNKLLCDKKLIKIIFLYIDDVNVLLKSIKFLNK